MTESEIIRGCIKHDRVSQKALYEVFFDKMFGVCTRYSKNTEEAKAILQLGFVSIFDQIKMYRGEIGLEDWIRKIVIDTSINYLKNNKQSYLIVNTINASQQKHFEEKELSDDELFETVRQEDILKALQNLSPAYRTVYNLHVFEKYTHKQIGERLDISEYTSASHYAKAQFNIRKNLSRICNDK